MPLPKTTTCPQSGASRTIIDPTLFHNWSIRVASRLVFRTVEFGFGRIDANMTALTFTYHGYNRDIVHDYFTLTRQR